MELNPLTAGDIEMPASNAKKVAVAMSGGVDSSVSALLLKREGFEPTGFTMTLFDAPAAAEDARRVADIIGIEHRTVDLRELFDKTVIDYFCETYLDGRTPNPCVVCNPKIKFGALFDHARTLGIDRMATGHYVQTALGADGGIRLMRGADETKDQTYFLYRLTQSTLSRLVFPVGGRRKSEVREIARAAGLPVHDKAESNDACFAAHIGDYKKVIARKFPDRVRPGKIVDTGGNVLGMHGGVHLFTIGQRRGMNVSAAVRLYVVDIDPETAVVTVGGNEDLSATALVCRDVNFISGEPLPDGAEIAAKVRYIMPFAPARVFSLGEGEYRVEFAAPVRAISPGQAVVFYRGPETLGGGTITTVLKNP